MFRTIAGIAIFAGMVIAYVGCSGERSEQVRGPKVPQRDVNAVMDEHAPELMNIPGVVGVAVSETEDHAPCILVMVREMGDSLKARIPEVLEGYPVIIEVTGEIIPFESPDI